MKPATFGILLLLLILLGGAAGGAAGYLIHEGNPYVGPQARPRSVGAELIQRFVGTEAVEAAYEGSRRRWAAKGSAGGAVLGLLAGIAIGSYSLRYRNTSGKVGP